VELEVDNSDGGSAGDGLLLFFGTESEVRLSVVTVLAPVLFDASLLVVVEHFRVLFL